MSIKHNTLSFLDKFQIHKKLPYSDETILVDKSTSQFILMKEILAQSTNEFKEAIESLEEQRTLSHSHLLHMVEYYTKSITQQNKTIHKIITFYEYSGHSLLEEINSRTDEERLFDENQLWNIICSIVMGLAFLQKKQVGHGCVSLLDIFITVDGCLKIVDPSISSTSPSQFTEGYYYSPQMLQYFADTQIHPQQIDIYKSDVFTLALCILHAAMLEPADSCLDYESSNIDFDELEDKLKIVSQYYSEQFVNVLIHMLSQNSNDRPDFIELEEYLINTINQRDEIFKKDVTLSMQFESLTNSIRTLKHSEPIEIQPTPPDEQNDINDPLGIPVITTDSYSFDVNLKTEIKSSIKFSSQPSEIILTESISVNNTDRSNTQKKGTFEIQTILKRVSLKQKQNIPSQSQSNVSMSISKDNNPIDSFYQDTQPKNLFVAQDHKISQVKQSKKEISIPAKGISRKWNVVKQPQKPINKGFFKTQTKNKANQTQIKSKRIEENQKVIKRTVKTGKQTTLPSKYK